MSLTHKRKLSIAWQFGFSLLWGLSIPYILLIRHTSFMMLARQEKIELASRYFFIIAPCLVLLFFFFLKSVTGWISSRKSWFTSMAICLLLSLIYTIGLFDLPPFPLYYDVKIRPNGQKNDLSQGNQVRMKSMAAIDIPGKLERTVTDSLEVKGNWVKSQNNFTYSGSGSASIVYRQFVQGGLILLFETNPHSGMVIVEQTGEKQVIDLYSPDKNLYEVHLATPFALKHADGTRKILLLLLLLSELWLINGIVFLGVVLAEQFFVVKAIRMRGMASLLLVILLSTPLYLIMNHLEKEVTFSDSQLEMVVREVLGNHEKPIYYQQLQTIASLDITGRAIYSLGGIENFSNLVELRADFNHISDLSPLKTLRKISILSLAGNHLADLEKAGLDQLGRLPLKSLNLDNNVAYPYGFYDNRLRDISLLKEFTLLEELSLQNNAIEDIDALVGLRNLRGLNLRDNKIQRLPDLCHMEYLQVLNLRGNRLVDIAPLHCLSGLKELNLHSNRTISSIEPIAKLTNLRKLILENVPIADQVVYLQPLTRLSYLNVSNCSLQNTKVLGDLMAKGALQDNPEQQVAATLIIRENPQLLQEPIPLHDIHPYWENISFRDPFILPLVGLSLPAPQFSRAGGLYPQGFKLELYTDNPALEILYTLDGSEPSKDNLNAQNPLQRTYRYQQALTIQSRSGDANVFSLFVTSNDHQSWLPEWHPPQGEVFKATVVRAKTFHPQTNSTSPTVAHTYFVDRDIYQRYPTLPIVSLSADYQDLFDPDSGIYTPAIPTGNFWIPYRYNERTMLANVEFFEIGGKAVFNGLYEVSLQGSTSRSSPQKGLMVVTDVWYGNKTIRYPLFHNTESEASQITEFKQFVMRGWGSARDWPVFFSDAYHQTLLAKADIEIQAYRPVIVFINGEYWGLHELREAIKNPEYLSYRTGIDPVNPGFDILVEYQGDVDEGDRLQWVSLVDFVTSHDLSLDENYQVVSQQVDIDNFIVYIIHGVFTGKKDWPGHNEARWRPRVEGGKWRWLQFDMDHGLNSDGRPEYDMLAHIMTVGAKPHPLFNALLKNQQFKEQFINTYLDYLNSYFLKAVEIDHFTNMVNELEPYIAEYQQRWQLNQNWEQGKVYALRIIERREAVRRSQLMRNFKLRRVYQVTLITDPGKGMIKINSIMINEDLPGVADPASWTGRYLVGVPIQVTAIPKPGYTFAYWEGVSSFDRTSAQLILNSQEDLGLTAVFTPAP